MMILFQAAVTLIMIFTCSFALWCEIFRYLDFIEVQYTKKIKKRTLWLIFWVITYLIALLYVLRSVLFY